MRLRRWLMGAALAAALVAAAGCRRVETATVSAGGTASPASSDIVDSLSEELARTHQLDRLTLVDSGGLVREAVEALTVKPIRFRTRGQKGARLHLAYAVLDRDWDAATTRPVFSVLARDAGGAVTTLFTSVQRDAIREEDRWREIDLRLDAFDGALVDLLFQVEVVPGEGEATLFEGRPYWSGIRVLRPDADAAKPPDIFLVILDTIRADHVGCYGYPKPTTPVIDALAGGGALFEKAFTHSPWTRPAVASLLYSDFPHRIDPNSAFNDPESFSIPEPDRPSLQSALRDAGYATHAITSQPNIAYHHGYAWGFDTYTLLNSDGFVTATFADALKPREKRRPVFFYLHLLGAHQPYEPVEGVTDAFLPPAESRRVFGRYAHIFDIERSPPAGKDLAGVIGLYDGEIREADNAVGRILEAIRERASRDAIVVVTSDHGEEFGEHGGWDHGHTYYDELLHVPLVIARPGMAAKRDARLVGLSDVAPTLLAAAGVDRPERFVGRDLFAPEFVEWSVLAENNMYEAPRSALRTDAAKFVYSRNPGQSGLIFDLAADPAEKLNLAGDPAWADRARTADNAFYGTGRPLARDTEWWMRFSGKAAHRWRVTYKSDEPVQPRLSVREGAGSRWTESPDHLAGVLEFDTAPGGSLRLALPLRRGSRKLAVRIEADGQPVGEDAVVVPEGATAGALLADLASPDARRAVLSAVDAPAVDERETLVVISGRSLAPSAPRNDSAEERERLRSLGYLQ